MKRIVTHSLALCAAAVLAAGNLVAITTVPPVQATSLAVLPALA